jgi:hypothetical protein
LTKSAPQPIRIRNDDLAEALYNSLKADPLNGGKAAAGG